jgi:hypothetical protein
LDEVEPQATVTVAAARAAAVLAVCAHLRCGRWMAWVRSFIMVKGWCWTG